MEIKITWNMAIPLIVLGLLVSLVAGVAIGDYRANNKSTGTKVSEAGFAALSSAAVTSVSAEVRGAVKSVQDNMITIEVNDELFSLEVPADMGQITLSITSEVTDEDRAKWQKYQDDMKTYNKAMEEYYSDAEDTTTPLEDVSLPQPPEITFVLGEAMPGDASIEGVATKQETSNIAITELKAGDMIQASLSAYSSAGTPDAGQGASDKSLRVISIYAIRDTTQTEN